MQERFSSARERLKATKTTRFKARRRGKYLPLLTDTTVNNCFNIYQTSGMSIVISHVHKLAKTLHTGGIAIIIRGFIL